MYDVRDLGSFLIMLIVLPLFAFVLVMSVAVVGPFMLLHEVWQAFERWLDTRASHPRAA